MKWVRRFIRTGRSLFARRFDFSSSIPYVKLGKKNDPIRGKKPFVQNETYRKQNR